MTSAAAVAIYALDVGQGDCSFIVSRDPADGVVLFDCNDPYVAERFVVDHEIRTLHAVVVSHLDRDHIRGMVPFLRAFLSGGGKVQHAFVGIDRDRSRIGSAAAELLDFFLDAEKTHQVALHASQREESPKVVWQVGAWSASLLLPRYGSVLHQQVVGDDEPNALSVALRVECGKSAVLVGGDVPLESWESAEPALLPARALRAPHHGGGIREGNPTWSEADLYTRISPDLVAISVGTNNSHGHPTPEHVAGIAPAHRRLVCTQLTPRCHDAVASVRAETLRLSSRVAYAPYRHRKLPGTTAPARPRDEVPCAGSIAIEMFEDGRVTFDPDAKDWHDRMITDLRFATPLCRPTP